jgi:putative ABC transport system permease protein
MSAFELQNFFISPLESGLIYVLLALGVFVAFRVLDIADLSVEGVFPLVSVLSCFLILHGWNPFLVVLLMVALGVVAGILNALLTLYLKIPPLLSGIIMMSALFAVSIIVIHFNGGYVNLASDDPTVFSGLTGLFVGANLTKFWASALAQLLIGGLALAAALALLYFFFGTEMGLALRAAGKNKQMARANGISVKAMTITGLGISSGLVALAATLYAQKGLSGTPQDGQGMIVLGLSILFLGEAIFPHHSFKTHLLAITGGSFVYWYIIQILLQWIPNSSTYLYLYKALLLVLVLAIPYLIKTIRKKHARKKEEEADAPLPESL